MDALDRYLAIQASRPPKKHAATYEVERAPDEGNFWTVTCRCGGLEESASSRAEARHEYRTHLAYEVEKKSTSQS